MITISGSSQALDETNIQRSTANYRRRSKAHDYEHFLRKRQSSPLISIPFYKPAKVCPCSPFYRFVTHSHNRLQCMATCISLSLCCTRCKNQQLLYYSYLYIQYTFIVFPMSLSLPLVHYYHTYKCARPKNTHLPTSFLPRFLLFLLHGPDTHFVYI